MRARRWPWGVLAAAFVVLNVACTRSEATTEAQGSELFGSNCSRCHGPNGGGGKAAFTGGPAPRNFRDHAFQRSRSDEELKATIQRGRGAMPAFGVAFDEAQLDALVARIRSFDPDRGPPSR